MLETTVFLFAYLTTAAILSVAAVVSVRGARRGRAWSGPERRRADRLGQDRRRTIAWGLLAVGVVVAGGLRATGGLRWLTSHGRQFAIEGGWYAGRRTWQIAAMVGAAVALLILAGLIARQRTAHRRQRVALAVALILAGVLAVRGISWHAAEVALGVQIVGVALGSWVELGVLASLAGAAAVGAGARGWRTSSAAPPRSG